ncbi:hypothetical protein HaLaN_26278 [Haematococcus lacustris]|uniref:Uncharacterized protein n=1 Tax=Haematococcus lacustris TaxID=44745 RepID=A0A6A0A5V6_HAELA|nr:hypothetical protein HaLaN_26278 [Haematococcus lacustris]
MAGKAEAIAKEVQAENELLMGQVLVLVPPLGCPPLLLPPLGSSWQLVLVPPLGWTPLLLPPLGSSWQLARFDDIEWVQHEYCDGASASAT